MPDPATIDRLRSSVLSAVSLKELQPEWSEPIIEEWLNFLENFVTIAELIDVEIDQKIEEIATDFTDGSLPFADSNLLTEDNTNLSWDNVLKVLSSLIVSTNKVILNTSAGLTPDEGEMVWDDDCGTAAIGMPGSEVVLQIGLEGLVRVSNKSGSDIKNGNLVYATGSHGNRITIDLADNSDPDKIYILGMVTEDIDSNENGFVALFGDVRGSTSQPIDTSTYAEGDKLYLSTAGGWTNTHPASATAGVIIIGRVRRVHATEGIIYLTTPQSFSIGNEFNGIMRQTVHNKSTGISAAAGFTAINDNGHYTTMGIAGSGNTTFTNESSVIYAPGYGDHLQAVDGNKDFVWLTDPTDSHNNSSLTNEVMRLLAAGHLKLVKDNSKMYWGAGDDASAYYDGTDFNIKTDEVAASDLLLSCGSAKTLELQTVVYEDLQVSISNIRLPASSAPADRLYNHGIGGGVTFPVLGFDPGEYIYFDIQTSHSMKLSTVLDNHIHYMTPTDGTGDKFQFQLDVIAAPISGNWAAPTGSPFTKEVTMVADLSNTHKITDIADIPAVNTTVSSIYKCKLTRIAATADEYAGEIYLEFTDCHYQKNTMGSRQEAAK